MKTKNSKTTEMYKMTKIYLATPYSHPDKTVRIARYKAVNKKAAELMEAGYIVFSPISHSHSIAEYLHPELRCSWPFWKTQDIPLLDWADELWVMEVDGWDKSTGVLAEIKHAKKSGKPIIMELP